MKRWKVSFRATWYWVKLTKHGELVTEFSHAKQPYEVIFLGQKIQPECEKLMDFTDQLVIFSVPSGIHSHKPPLDKVLQTVLEKQLDRSWDSMSKLELFGRSLLPGWFTVGRQPCLLNYLIE